MSINLVGSQFEDQEMLKNELGVKLIMIINSRYHSEVPNSISYIFIEVLYLFDNLYANVYASCTSQGISVSQLLVKCVRA